MHQAWPSAHENVTVKVTGKMGEKCGARRWRGRNMWSVCLAAQHQSCTLAALAFQKSVNVDLFVALKMPIWNYRQDLTKSECIPRVNWICCHVTNVFHLQIHNCAMQWWRTRLELSRFPGCVFHICNLGICHETQLTNTLYCAILVFVIKHWQIQYMNIRVSWVGQSTS